MNQTVVPLPSSLSAPTSPPMACTMWRTIAKPSPVPPSERARALSERLGWRENEAPAGDAA